MSASNSAAGSTPCRCSGCWARAAPRCREVMRGGLWFPSRERSEWGGSADRRGWELSPRDVGGSTPPVSKLAERSLRSTLRAAPLRGLGEGEHRARKILVLFLFLTKFP